jgi:hypothetical protein
MHGLCVERRSLKGQTSLSLDLAHHMYARSLCGKMIVVTNKPKELLSATRKQWIRLSRQVMNERASTLNETRALELTHMLSRMQDMRFAAEVPDDLLEADVTFATIDDFVQVPPICPTVYVTCAVEREQLHLLTSWLPEQALVILYE